MFRHVYYLKLSHIPQFERYYFMLLSHIAIFLISCNFLCAYILFPLINCKSLGKIIYYIFPSDFSLVLGTWCILNKCLAQLINDHKYINIPSHNLQLYNQ